MAARATLRVVEKLDDTKTGVSSSLHSLNIEFGRLGWQPYLEPRGARVLVADRSGGHCSAAPAANLNHTALRGLTFCTVPDRRGLGRRSEERAP